MKRVLFSGASGFIGSNVLRYLLEKTDWEFVCLASWRHKGNPLFTPKNDRVNMVYHDLRGKIPDLGYFDYILNLASESHVDRSIEDPLNFIENNVSSTLQMLEYARLYHPDKFIQFSTDEVYGANLHEEWDLLLPTNPYAASKAAQEVICIAYFKTYNIQIVITNSNNVIGPNQDKEKFIPKVIELIKRDQTIEIHTVDNVPGRRYWNPVDNVSDALKYILDLTLPDPIQLHRPVRFSLSGGEELNNLEMAQLIAKKLGKNLNYEFVEASTIRPSYDKFYPKTKGMLEVIGWKPIQTLEEGLAWIKN